MQRGRKSSEVEDSGSYPASLKEGKEDKSIIYFLYEVARCIQDENIHNNHSGILQRIGILSHVSEKVSLYKD